MTTRRAHLTHLGLAATAGLTAAAAAPLSPAATAAPLSPAATAAPLSPAAAGAPRQAGAPRRIEQDIVLSARRREITLPALPPLGVTYIATFDLFDSAGATVGEAFAGASVVDVTLDGPVVLATVVLRLAAGEIHYQRVMNRFGAYPRTAIGAILGGTGDYSAIRGVVDISWPDADRIDLVVRPVE
jgi:hypothetical protein